MHFWSKSLKSKQRLVVKTLIMKDASPFRGALPNVEMGASMKTPPKKGKAPYLVKGGHYI